jgi:hypothetical protein
MSKLRTIILCVSLVLILVQGFGTSSSTAIAKEPTIHCTILTSGGDIGLGGLKIYISGKALKVVELNGKGYLVASAPSWRVVQFNPNTNLGLTKTREEWMAHTPQYTIIAPPPDDPFVWQQTRAQSIKVFGKDCIKSRTHRHYKDSQNSNEHEYVFLPDPAVSEVACHILQKLVSTPSVKGIPISFKSLGEDSHKSGGHLLFTTSKVEEGDVPEKFFSYPTGYKLAKSEPDLYSDAQRNRLIEETFGY